MPPHSAPTATRSSAATTTARSRRPRAATRAAPARPRANRCDKVAPAMDLSFILAAAETAEHLAEEHEKSELPFFVMGGLWALFAIAISVYGFKEPDFPDTAGVARGVMSAGVLLTLGAVGSAIYVAL